MCRLSCAQRHKGAVQVARTYRRTGAVPGRRRGAQLEQTRCLRTILRAPEPVVPGARTSRNADEALPAGHPISENAGNPWIIVDPCHRAFSLASMLLTTILGLWLDGLTSPSTRSDWSRSISMARIVFGVIALDLPHGGVTWTRGTKLQKIKDESKEIPSAGSGSAGDGRRPLDNPRQRT